jgi:transcriptional regulator with XRE-family HTH domain
MSRTSDSDLHEPVNETLQSLLGLTDGEVEMIDCRIGLANAIKDERKARGLTQRQMAELVGMSQTRTSAIERGDVSVSFDLMAEAFFAMGKTRFDLAKVLAGDLFRPESGIATEAQVKRSPRAAKKAAAVARTKRAPRRKTV